MFFEYALDPRSIDNWPTLRYVSENFGPSRGRLLSKFPSSWAREALENAMARPGDKLRIVEKLRDIEKNLLRTKRPYNSDMSWISNALSIQPDEPFHAIIAKTDCDHPCFVHIDELDESNPLWKVGLDGKIKRNASEIARVASPLLSISAEAVLVDQHYSSTAKHGRPLAALIAAARNGKKLSRMEYHLNSDGDSLAFQVGLNKQLPYLDLKNEEEIVFIRWRRIDGGENMHPRYILTNRGGIRFDFGLDEGDGSTDYARLSEELWRQRWEQFKPDSQVLKLVDAWRAKMIPPPGSPTNNLVPSVKPVRWAETRWVES
jgi:hypothetical protein